MGSLLISLNIVIPMFLLILTGYLLDRIGLLTKGTSNDINSLVSLVFVPCLLFINMYNSDLRTTFNPTLLWFSIIGILITFGALIVIVPIFEKEDKKRAVIIHSLFRSNTVIFGTALAQGIVGSEGNIDDLILVMSTMIILYNILGVVILQVYSGKRSSLFPVIKGIIANPMIIGGFLGLILALKEWKLPSFIISPISNLASVTTPLAFLSLGASFNLRASVRNLTRISIVVIARLILVPIVWISIGVIFLGFRRGEVAALLAVFATPTAVNTFPLATAANVDSELAGEIIVFTTSASILTLFAWISILYRCGVL